MRFVVLFVWLWLPLLLWALYLGPSEPYDLALLYPASFWAMGLAVDSLIGWLKSGGGRSWRWLAWVQLPIWLLLVGMISWQGYRIVYLYDWLAHHDAQQGGYGTPYRFWRHVANLARRSVKGTGTNQVWVVTEGTDPDRDEQPLVLRYLLEPHVEPIFLGQNGTECMLLPAGRPAIYLLSRSAPRVEQMLHRLRAEEKGVVLSPGGTREVRVWALPWHEVEDMLGLVSQRGLWRWDSGLWLVGYDLPAMVKPGESMTFISSWTFKDIPPRELAARHILFGYLVGSDGAYAASWADLGLPERYWAEGLLLLHWMELKLPETAPEGGYTFLLGMDRLDDAYRHQLMGAQGQILGETLSLGPIHVSR